MLQGKILWLSLILVGGRAFLPLQYPPFSAFLSHLRGGKKQSQQGPVLPGNRLRNLRSGIGVVGAGRTKAYTTGLKVVTVKATKHRPNRH